MNEHPRIADFHVDRINPFLSEILQNPEFLYSVDRRKQLSKEGLQKVDLIFASTYRRANDEIRAAAVSQDQTVLEWVRAEIRKLLEYYHATKDFKIITQPEDLNLSKEPGQENVVLHLEGGDIISGPEVVDELFERGVRSIGPVYTHDNQIGGGNAGNKDRGLSVLGKQIIDKIIEKGMILDLAHANRRTAHDIFR